MSHAPNLAVSLGAVQLQNPILLAAGTAGYGREVAGVIDLESLGGLVTKAVSVEVRKGAPSPRVAEFDGGMINAIGLANPGVQAVREEALPWLASNVQRARVLVNVVGSRVEDYAAVVSALHDAPGKAGFELNVSCPNVKAGGLEFGADRAALEAVVRGARACTSLPLFVKLSPTLADIAGAANVALDAGADGLTLTNTLPGLVIDVERRRPALGFGTGGVSGAALMPAAVLATWRVYRATKAPIIGVGGVASASDALQFLLAGARAVAIGTAAMRDPRIPERIVRHLAQWMDRHDVTSLEPIIGSLEWPAPA
ncbi:MAG: dihydroorotate dehydrogenase [Gemmatimonadaceae bacterium]